MAVDYTDACAREAALRDAYFDLVSGKGAQTVEYSDSGQSRSVTYATSKADIKRLYDEWQAAKEECATGNPVKRTRFAMRGGSLRRGW